MSCHNTGSHRGTRTTVSARNNLGHDREGRLGRGPAAQVEAYRATQPCQILLPHPGGDQPLAAIGLSLARTDGTDVAAAAAQGLDDRRLVELHIVAQDRHRVVRAEGDLVGDLVGPTDDETIRRREAVRRDERGPPINNDRLVAELPGEPYERSGDLDGADDDEPRSHRECLEEE